MFMLITNQTIGHALIAIRSILSQRVIYCVHIVFCMANKQLN